MKAVYLAVILLIGKIVGCYAQKTPDELQYQLIKGVLDGLRSQAVSSVKKGVDGKYYWRNMPTDTPTVRLLLLDQPYSVRETEEFLLASPSSDMSKRMRRYFTPADILHMERQLPAMRQFKVDSSYVQQQWVTVLSRDTLQQRSERRKKRAGNAMDFTLNNDFLREYGAWQLYSISGMLFSLDKKRALVTVGFGSGWDLWVYRKKGVVWRKEVALYSVIE